MYIELISYTVDHHVMMLFNINIIFSKKFNFSLNKPFLLLQCLFQSDQILYTVVPVTGKEDLDRAYVENSEGVRIFSILSSICCDVDV